MFTCFPKTLCLPVRSFYTVLVSAKPVMAPTSVPFPLLRSSLPSYGVLAFFSEILEDITSQEYPRFASYHHGDCNTGGND
jgi:hypothetical protein